MLQERLSDLRGENKYNRHRLKELTESRDKWKSKNATKSKQIKSLSQKIERRDKISRHQYSGLVIYLCLVLRVYCKCSYRSVCKVIEQLVLCSFLKLNRIPSPTSIQNWVTKMEFYQRQSLEDELINKERVLIVDESIRIGQEKQLLILSTPYEQYNRVGGLCSEDVSVHYFEGRTSWTGEQVSEELKKVIVSTGMVCKAVLSDEDSKLKKASRLQQLPHLSDICHATVLV